MDVLKVQDMGVKFLLRRIKYSTFTEIVGFNVVTGVDFGEESLLDDAADSLTDGIGIVSRRYSALILCASP